MDKLIRLTKNVLIIMSILFTTLTPSLAKEVAFTQEDRERIIKLEEGQKAINQRIDDIRTSLQQQIDDTKTSLQKQIDDTRTLLQQQIDDTKTSLQKQIDDTRTSLQSQIDDTKTLLQKQIDDTRISLQKQIDDIKTFMLWGFGILFGGMGILIGFVIWDRRTALAPAIKKNKELEDREERIERALKELAEKDPKVADILKHVGLL
ncbi:MAG: hypothetical protein D6828_06890 [Nitrospirae bacterium]|nr:MAG: hypothetical protein D6828_06890 [Nitrospirota bacterium]